MSNLGLLEGDELIVFDLTPTSLFQWRHSSLQGDCSSWCMQRDCWSSTLSPPFNLHGFEENCRLIVISSFLTILDPAFKSWGRVKWGRTDFLNERLWKEPIERWKAVGFFIRISGHFIIIMGHLINISGQFINNLGQTVVRKKCPFVSKNCPFVPK